MLAIYILCNLNLKMLRCTTDQNLNEFLKNIKEKKKKGQKYLKNKDITNAIAEYEGGVVSIKNKLHHGSNSLKPKFKFVKTLRDQLSQFYYEMSLIYFNQQNYFEAMNKLKSSIFNNVKDNKATSKMAVCYFKTAEIDKAMQMASKIKNQSKELKNMSKNLRTNVFTEKFGKKYVSEIDISFCKKLMNVMLRNQILNQDAMLQILGSGFNAHSNLDNIQSVLADDAIVFGDTNGQFLDTCNTLNNLGCKFDCENFILNNKTYIFNGNMIGNGCVGRENFLFLLLLKKIYPLQIYLNRGSHEFEYLGRQINANEKRKSKSMTEEDKLASAFQIAFSALPLCTILNHEYFIVHGGISEITISIDQIQNINRFQMIKDNTPINDLMWNDPGDVSYTINSALGAGAIFGCKVTRLFLSYNNFKMIIRSHEFVKDGIKYDHDTMVVTIFSAPNYHGMKVDAAVLSVKNGEIHNIKVKNWEQSEVFRKMINDLVKIK